VLVVDDDGGAGVDYQELLPAIAASQDGDIILLRAGYYDGGGQVGEINGRSLTIVGEGLPVLYLHRINIGDVNSGQHIVMRGIETQLTQLNVVNCSGGVWLEEMNIGPGLNGATGGGTVDCTDCTNVVVTRSGIVGSSGTLFTFAGSAIRCENSSVSVWDSTLTGGFGDDAPTHGGNRPGGSAVVVESGSTYLADCDVIGGDGGPGQGTPGGHGALLLGGDLLHMATTFTGGQGSPDGQALNNFAGQAQQIPDTPRHLSVSAPNRYGSNVSVTVEGLPLDYVLLPHSLMVSHQYLPNGNGPFLIDPAGLFNASLGLLPASGQLNLNLTTPVIPGLDGLTIFVQGLFVDPSGLHVSSPTATIFLDPQF
jgi:hypothetical protein